MLGPRPRSAFGLLSRRAALGALGAAAATLGLRRQSVPVQAQAATPVALASHPIVDAWNAQTPAGPALAIFAADGTVTMGVPATQTGPNGVVFVSAEIGAWEPTGPRSVHFTAIQLLSDAAGTLLGSVTIDGYPEVSADGQSQRDDLSRAMVTVRDAHGAIIQQSSEAGAPPVVAQRIRVGAPGFAPSTTGIATPTG